MTCLYPSVCPWRAMAGRHDSCSGLNDGGMAEADPRAVLLERQPDLAREAGGGNGMRLSREGLRVPVKGPRFPQNFFLFEQIVPRSGFSRRVRRSEVPFLFF